jgi:hypothetical protein
MNDRLLGVDGEVQDDLLQLGEDRHHHAPRSLVDIDVDIQLFELALAQLEHGRDDVAQPDRRRLRHLAAEARQVCG